MIHSAEKHISSNIPVKAVYFSHLLSDTTFSSTQVQQQGAKSKKKSSHAFMLTEAMKRISEAVCQDNKISTCLSLPFPLAFPQMFYDSRTLQNFFSPSP
jgi:hypothetical protein